MKTSSSLLRKRPIAIVIGVAAMILVTSPLTEPAQQHLAGHYYHGQSGHSSSGLLKLAYGNLCYDGGRAIVC